MNHLKRASLLRASCLAATSETTKESVKRTQAAASHYTTPHYTRVDFNGKDGREAREAVSQYYRQHEITNSASKESVRINPAALLYTGKQDFEENDFLRTTQFLQTELPVRVAHRIKGFRQLPFIVTTNPKVLEVMELYMESHAIITSFNKYCKRIVTMKEALEFTNLLQKRLDIHGNVINKLSEGFSESHDFIIDYCGNDTDAANDLVQSFLNRSYTSRLGIRLLVTHHLKLRDQIDQQRATSDQIGIIHKNWRPAEAIDQIAEELRREFRLTYGKTIPRVKLGGHLNTSFHYIPAPGFDTIVEHVLRNSFRAVMDTKGLSSTKQMPAVEVTIAVNETHFMIKIADRGNGIAPDQMKKIWHYGHTGHKRNKKQHQNSQGIGLPLSRAYAQYLGGSIDIKSLHGIGCDTYVKLARIDTIEGFRI